MGGHSRDSTLPRRVSEPHHHHSQPKHFEPSTMPERPRRHTEGSGLTRIVSRPEDYKNKPRPNKMVEYICFDENEEPDPRTCCEEPEQIKEKEKEDAEVPLNRYESSSSRGTVDTSSGYESDDDECDSEDELTLPSSYHHDAAHDDYHHQDWSNARRKESVSSVETEHQHDLQKYTHRGPDDDWHHHDSKRSDSDSHRHEHRTSPVRRNDPHHHSSDSDSKSHESDLQVTPASETAAKLIQAVAQHLQSHKDAYQHSGGHHGSMSDVVNELLSEVVRKVADGGLNGDMAKEVVREIQHVL